MAWSDFFDNVVITKTIASWNTFCNAREVKADLTYSHSGADSRMSKILRISSSTSWTNVSNRQTSPLYIDIVVSDFYYTFACSCQLGCHSTALISGTGHISRTLPRPSTCHLLSTNPLSHTFCSNFTVLRKISFIHIIKQ